MATFENLIVNATINACLEAKLSDIEEYVSRPLKERSDSQYSFTKKNYCPIKKKSVRLVYAKKRDGSERVVAWHPTESEHSVVDLVEHYKNNYGKDFYLEIYYKGSKRPYIKRD